MARVYNVDYNSIFWLENVEVDPSNVCEEDWRLVFTRGHCHALALAVYDELGGRLVADYDCESDEVPQHVLVEAGGQYLDARTWLPDGHTIESFLGERQEYVTREFVENLPNFGYRPTEYEMARECLATLLSR